MLDKDQIARRTFTLRYLWLCLLKIFPELSVFKGRDSVLAIGNTGCGKSTMLSALIYGPEQLEVQVILSKQKVGKIWKTKK